MHAAAAKRRAPHFSLHRAPRRAAALRRHHAQPARIAIPARIIAGVAPTAVSLLRTRGTKDLRHAIPCGIARHAAIDIARVIVITSSPQASLRVDAVEGIGARNFATRGEILKICRQRRSHGRSETLGGEFFIGVLQTERIAAMSRSERRHPSRRQENRRCANQSRPPTRNGLPRSTAARSPIM